uniref:Hyaluronidase n=1 Tax=Nannospalax galili TaxID=1026970 RepID=A0A8C6RWG1_NANGA
MPDAWPVLLQASERPFSLLWNVPSARCKAHFGVHLPLNTLGIITSHGQHITIFYKNHLYPYLGPKGTAYNGGIPQAVFLECHLAQVAHQIHHSLGSSFAGLATLKLGQALQPYGLWGSYHYPACGNSWHNMASNYTGHCHAVILTHNTQLHWLWATSNALFPSIYLPPRLPPAYHQAFVLHRLEEAFHVAPAGYARLLPVLAYAQLTHRSSGRFLSQECWHLHDYLVGTLGPYVISVTKAAMACS